MGSQNAASPAAPGINVRWTGARTTAGSGRDVELHAADQLADLVGDVGAPAAGRGRGLRGRRAEAAGPAALDGAGGRAADLVAVVEPAKEHLLTVAVRQRHREPGVHA